MTDHYVTDGKHLVEIAEKAIKDLEWLAHGWLREDAMACSPRQSSDGTTSGGHLSDPTHRVAVDDHGPDLRKYGDRDRLGRRLVKLATDLAAERQRWEPRHTGGPCACCEFETATHGRDDRGQPTDCWRCWRHLRDHGVRCSDQVHQDRPRTRMCECGDNCCDICPDRAAPNRTVSERCRKRMQRQPTRKAG